MCFTNIIRIHPLSLQVIYLFNKYLLSVWMYQVSTTNEILLFLLYNRKIMTVYNEDTDRSKYKVQLWIGRRREWSPCLTLLFCEHKTWTCSLGMTEVTQHRIYRVHVNFQMTYLEYEKPCSSQCWIQRQTWNLSSNDSQFSCHDGRQGCLSLVKPH